MERKQEQDRTSNWVHRKHKRREKKKGKVILSAGVVLCLSQTDRTLEETKSSRKMRRRKRGRMMIGNLRSRLRLEERDEFL